MTPGPDESCAVHGVWSAQRRTLLRAAAGAALLQAPIVRAQRAVGPPLPKFDQPSEWIRRSRAEALVLVILFTVPGCPYCEALRRDHLRHLERAGRARGVLVSETDFTDTKPWNDPQAPDWIESSPNQWARRIDVRFSPTLTFFGARGELAERIVGYNGSDFYGAYLDERIATARAALTQ